MRRWRRSGRRRPSRERWWGSTPGGPDALRDRHLGVTSAARFLVHEEETVVALISPGSPGRDYRNKRDSQSAGWRSGGNVSWFHDTDRRDGARRSKRRDTCPHPRPHGSPRHPQAGADRLPRARSGLTIKRMFDLSEGRADGVHVLEPRAIDAVADALSAALERPSEFDASALVDAIRALERLSCIVTAAQAHLSVELDVSRREAQAAEGVLRLIKVAESRRRWHTHAGSRLIGASVTWVWP